MEPLVFSNSESARAFTPESKVRKCFCTLTVLFVGVLDKKALTLGVENGAPGFSNSESARAFTPESKVRKCFFSLTVLFVGVLNTRALAFGVDNRAPGFFKLRKCTSLYPRIER